jgi:hypothetical protein
MSLQALARRGIDLDSVLLNNVREHEYARDRDPGTHQPSSQTAVLFQTLDQVEDALAAIEELVDPVCGPLLCDSLQCSYSA